MEINKVKRFAENIKISSVVRFRTCMKQLLYYDGVLNSKYHFMHSFMRQRIDFNKGRRVVDKCRVLRDLSNFPVLSITKGIIHGLGAMCYVYWPVNTHRLVSVNYCDRSNDPRFKKKKKNLVGGRLGEFC